MNELDPYLQETFEIFEIGPIFFFVEPEQVGEISKISGNPGIFVQQIQGFASKTVPENHEKSENHERSKASKLQEVQKVFLINFF